MKRVLSFLAVFCMTLLSGIVLFACGGTSNFKIEIQNNSNLLEIVLKEGNKTLQLEADGKYEVKTGANIKVEINATDYGVDLSELSVKVGDISKSVIKNSDYSILPKDESLNFGYFLLSNISSNLNINFSGAKKAKSTFTFDISQDDLENQEIVEKLKMTYIDTTIETPDVPEQNEEENPDIPVETPNTYENLYDFLTGEGVKSFEREFDSTEGIENKYKTFKVKFDGVNPFNLTEGFPFKIVDNQSQKPVFDMSLVDDSYYVIDMGELGESSQYTILVDFAGLNFTQFNISVPEDNMTFKIDVDTEIINFANEKILTITKLLASDKVDYSNMKVLLNSLELTKVENSETEFEVQYLIPKGITPVSTGGLNVYRVTVSGIEYLVDSYSMYANSNEGNQGFTPFISPNIWSIDEEGNILGITGIGTNGEQISLAGERNAVVWGYSKDAVSKAYNSVFDLYDYNLYINQTKVLNIKDVVGDSTEDLVVDFTGGYVLRAFYNADTSKYDRFQFEFVCNSDMLFEFSDFVLFEKNIDISYFFDDNRIDSVEYAISNYEFSNYDWQELVKDEPVRVSVTGKQIVAFRLISTKNVIGTHEFKIADSSICNSWLNGETSSESGFNYTILKFVVSDIQYDGSMEFKLIPAGSMI